MLIMIYSIELYVHERVIVKLWLTFISSIINDDIIASWDVHYILYIVILYIFEKMCVINQFLYKSNVFTIDGY